MARSETPNEDYGKPLPHDPHFNGPLKNRSCTDIICLLLFIVFIGCWVGIGIFAYTQGNPETLLKPRDSNKSRCGLDSHVLNKKNLFFFDLTKCSNPSVIFTGCKTPQICVESCPDENFIFNKATMDDNDVKNRKWYCVDDVTPPKSVSEAEKLISENKCARWHIRLKPFLNRCIQPNDIDISSLAPELLQNLEEAKKAVSKLEIVAYAEQIGHDVVQDLKKSWKEIIGGVLIGICFCIIYIALLRWIAGIMICIAIFGILGILSAGVWYFSSNYSYYKEHPTEYENADGFLDTYLRKEETWLVLLIITSIILIIFLLILIFLRKRILLAIALIKEGSKAVSSALSSLAFPIAPWILQMLVIIYTISVALYLSSVGSPIYKVRNLDSNCACIGYKDGDECDPLTFRSSCSPGCTAECHFKGMNNPAIVSYLHAWNIVGFFWGICFVAAFGQMVLAATFATWYWTKPKRNIPFFTVTAAILRTLRYHIGTLAFGSLIIAICKMIRVCLEYIDHKLKKYDNPVTRAIMCCLKCFFWCLEKFLKFINKNAYIMCAIHGKNFCLSAKDAFSLLMRNIIRVFVLDKVTDFLFFLSKLLVTAVATAIMWSIMFYTTKENYTYYYVPAIFVGICIYIVSYVFFDVYSMAVDTLFLCYLEDCERNDGSAEKPYYMSKELGKIFGKKNKSS